MGLPELSATLLRERQVLERALHRPDQVPALREVDLARAVEAQAVAEDLGLQPEADLRSLADAAPAPWGRVLAEHRAELVRLCGAPGGERAPQTLRDALGD